VFFFFFQAEDGIRDLTVTGVQTCALPILRQRNREKKLLHESADSCKSFFSLFLCLIISLTFFLLTETKNSSVFLSSNDLLDVLRSEERRVGKECSSQKLT